MMDWENLGWPKATFSRMNSSSLFLFSDSFPNSKKNRKRMETGKCMTMVKKKKKKGEKSFAISDNVEIQ